MLVIPKRPAVRPFLSHKPETANQRSDIVVSGYEGSLSKSVLNGCLLLLMAPVGLVAIAVVAAAIWFFQGGPIFYSHPRIGKNGQFFNCLKFRTMVPGADDRLRDLLAENPDLQAEWNETHKLKQDPRLSRCGKFLRKTSLDELPQFFNVFVGDMLIVGPRPIMPEELGLYGKYAAHYTAVRPGITGLWQVSGRSNLPFKKRVALDVLYVKKASVWTDAYILLKTPWTVLTSCGAV